MCLREPASMIESRTKQWSFISIALQSSKGENIHSLSILLMIIDGIYLVGLQLNLKSVVFYMNLDFVSNTNKMQYLLIDLKVLYVILF